MDINALTMTFSGLVSSIESNPLIITLCSGGIIWVIVSHITSIFWAIKNFITDLISFTVTNTYTLDRGCVFPTAQKDINTLITTSTPLWERNIEFSTMTGDNSTNSYGFSIRWMFNRPVVVFRTYSTEAMKLTMRMEMRVFFMRKKTFLKKVSEFMEKEANSRNENKTESVSVNIPSIGNSLKFKRPIDTIYTNNNATQKLYIGIKSFIENKDVYKKINCPYHYSALLYGVPGSGKTSSIVAVASALNMSLSYINLKDMKLSELLSEINRTYELGYGGYETDEPIKNNGKILVFEDIDAINKNFNDNRNTDKKTEGDCKTIKQEVEDAISMYSGVMDVSLSDILNITDGLLSRDGTICIFTTNHVERLDTALLRAGRMSLLLEYTYLNKETSNRMIKDYLGYEVDGINDNLKPAELQELILKVLTKELSDDEFKEMVRKLK